MNPDRLRRFDGLFSGLFFLLLAWTIGHAIWHKMQPETIPVPPLYFKEGTWYTDGSHKMTSRAVEAAQSGEIVSPSGGHVFWDDEGVFITIGSMDVESVSLGGKKLPEKKP